MPIEPSKFAEHEAWLLFRLNDAPLRTEADGDFTVLAVMDVATGLILGMEFVAASSAEPSEFESRRLLAAAEAQTQRRPRRFFVDAEVPLDQFVAVARAMGMEVIAASSADLDPLTREAREGLMAHLYGANGP